MKFVLLTYRDPAFAPDADERAAIPDAAEAWCTEMDGRGVRLQGHVRPKQRYRDRADSRRRGATARRACRGSAGANRWLRHA